MAKRFILEKIKKKEKWNIFGDGEKLSNAELLKGAQIQILSNRRLVIEGCLGVYEYNESYLKLRLIKGALVVCGTNFDISAFENETITVNGKIDTLEFCE